jgi:hypothetical protein
MYFREFWMVLGNGAPTYRHDTEENARQEAERLARLSPGCEFFVLAATGKVVKSDLAWSQPTDDPGIPF